MGNRISDNAPNLWNVNIDSQSESLLPETEIALGTATPNFSNNDSKRFEIDADADLLRQQVTARFVQEALPPSSDADLSQRANKLSELFTGGGKRTYESVAPHIQGLSADDNKKLIEVYSQKTGRDLRRDAANYLLMEDRFKAFRILAPERIYAQTEPQAPGTSGIGIKMDPPTKEVLQGAQIRYTLNPPLVVGKERISHLERDEYTNLEKEGASFVADYREEKNYQVTFEVRSADNSGLPEFYIYRISVKNAESKTLSELGNLPGTAPDSELYVAYLDGQIVRTKQSIADLEARRDTLYGNIRNGVGNSADNYTQVRGIEEQLETLKNSLPEMETARAEVSNALSNSVGKPIPLKAVLVARENGQAIPLQLYAKDLGGGKWAIVDVTNPTKPRTWTSEGMLPTDALNQAWNNFVNGTNDLPPGQIAAVKPQGLGLTNENVVWNSPSSGQSTLKQWSNGLGVGSLVLGGLGIASIFGPGTQSATVPLLLASGVLGGASAGTNTADRLNNGTFQWKSTETALDMLGVVGGVASLGGIGAMTNAGRTVIANGAKYTVQNLGNFTRIAQVAENGTNVAGSILIANQYVSAMDAVNRSSMSPDQKVAETRKILMQAVAMGGVMILGVGVSTKLAKVSQAANYKEVELWINKQVKVGDPLPEGYQWHGNQIKRRANFVEKNYAPLQINSEGRIAYREGIERLSNPNLMRNNFKTEVENRLRAKGLTGEALRRRVEAEMSRVQIHHIIPDELVQSTELGKAAQNAGYNLDEASNLRGMPRTPGDRLDEFDVEHRGSHPRYTSAVEREMMIVTNELKRKYKTKTLDTVPPEIIKSRMREVETKFRQKITNNDVELKDGKLALLPTNLINGGRYEVRV